MTDLLHIDPVLLLRTIGYAGLFIVIFAESGLFFGFLFPGDSLLFAAGLLASQGFFDPFVLGGIIIAGAILGDSFGYWFGLKTGPRLFAREDSFFFNKKHIDRTNLFYAKYGTRAVILARFVPVVRTFTPIFAGIGGMSYHLFLRYNIIGGVLWTIVLVPAGYLLGATVPGSEQYLTSIAAGIIAVSFLPILREVWKNAR